MKGFSVPGRLWSPPSVPNSGLCWEEGACGSPDQLPHVDFSQPRGFQRE